MISVLSRLIDLFKLSTPRVLSTIISAGSFAFLLKYLESESFVELQILVSISGLLLWMTDFGLINQSMIEIGNENCGLGRKLAFYRFWSILFSLSAIGIYFQFDSINYIRGLVISAVAIDLLTDNLLNLRLIISQSHLSYYSLVYKKIFQVILFCYFTFSGGLNLITVAISILTPALIMMILDFSLIYGLNRNYSDFNFKKSLKNWIQSGGTSITGFDFWILGSNQVSLIQLISIARKISNFVTIPVQSIIPHTVSRKISLLRLSKLSKKEKTSLFTVLLLSLCSAIVVNPIISLFFGIELLERERLLLVLIILIVPIGSLTYLNNLKLLKYECFKELIWINWFSSFIYLLSLLIGRLLGNIFWGFCIGIILNTFLELLGQILTFRKVENNA